MIDPKLKSWIDNVSYEALFRRWRFGHDGDPVFQGETGKYYAEVMAKKREEVGPVEHTRISKLIGWG